MNQIPNIEETHNTIEVEEKKYPSHKELDMEKYYRIVKSGSFDNMFNYGFEVGKAFHHHQLQKAREETIHRILAIVSSKQNQFTSTYERGYQDCVKNILESIHHYQSKLDKPN